MNPDQIALLSLGILAVAFLYASTGQAGGTGFIAVMSFFSLAPDAIKPLALALNVLVAALGAWQFYRAGHFSWPLFWPLALLAVPAAFLGGYLHLPARTFQILVGAILLLSAALLLARLSAESEPKAPPRAAALGLGAGIGLLAGLTGTGGGVLLTPCLLLMGWARTKTAAAVSVLFILLNSAAALIGNLSATRAFPDVALPMGAAALVGGVLGAYFGSRRFSATTVRRLLAVVLCVAGLKLLLAP